MSISSPDLFPAALFHKLSKALEVLSDPKAKAAFDAVLKAKERAKLRTHALDAKRKKFKLGTHDIVLTMQADSELECR